MSWSIRPDCGIQVTGLRLNQITPGQLEEVKEQWSQHGVIFFEDSAGPNGQQLTEAEHIAFASSLGKVNVNRFFPYVEAFPEIAKVEKLETQAAAIGEAFHSDHTYDFAPASGSMLVARSLPKTGGDTIFVSMYKAYESLPEEMKQKLEGMRAIHSSRQTFGAKRLGSEGTTEKSLYSNPEAATQDTCHPVVITHPTSGRKSLFVNPTFTIAFEGQTIAESAPLLQELYRHALQPAHMHQYKFKSGAAVLWDNRAVWHCAINDYQGQYRLMHRITIEGVPLEAGKRGLAGSAVYTDEPIEVFGDNPMESPYLLLLMDALNHGCNQLGIPNWLVARAQAAAKL